MVHACRRAAGSWSELAHAWGLGGHLPPTGLTQGHSVQTLGSLGQLTQLGSAHW